MTTNKTVLMVVLVVIAFSFVAAALTSAQVTALWSKLYNGGGDDLAFKVAVDSEDSVIVTGWSDNVSSSISFDYDYYTIKYDKNGTKKWDMTYDADDDLDMAFSVAVDSEDNVIVTGWSLNGTYDYYTIKYAKANGQELWSKRYDGGFGWPSADLAFEIAVDSEDNVIVTGWSHNGTNYSYYTVKYAKNNGDELWNRTYNGGLDDLALEIAIDSEDNVIVTGWSDNATTKYDYLTIKYDKNGTELWNRTYNGGSEDLAFEVVRDSEDSVIVTGASQGSGYNYHTIKYDKNGTELWNRTYDGGAEDLALGIAVDSQDNVIVTGWSSPDLHGTSYDYYTIKYDKNGTELWNRTYDGGADDIAFDVTVDLEDSVIVTGASEGSGYNYHTIKYDKNGTKIWDKTYDRGFDDFPFDIQADSMNNVVLSGPSHGAEYFSYYTIKYGASDGQIPLPPVPAPVFSLFGFVALIAVVTIVMVSRILRKR